jgi:SAM-dependent methyltransferase
MTMARDTDADWTKIADENPYWGVLSSEEYRGADLDVEVKERFLASGEEYVANLLGFVHKHIEQDFQINRALDFGCGVGRLLIPLAKHAKEAIGVDVAPGMLKLARENIRFKGISNATVVLGDDSLSKVSGTFNFINTFIVLQHIDPERGMSLIRRLMALLEVGGIFSLHLTFAKERKFFMHEQGRATYYRRSGKIIHDLLPPVSQTGTGTITMYDYDLNEVMALVSSVAGQRLLVLPTNHDGHLGLQLVGEKNAQFD